MKDNAVNSNKQRTQNPTGSRFSRSTSHEWVVSVLRLLLKRNQSDFQWDLVGGLGETNCSRKVLYQFTVGDLSIQVEND